MKKATKLKIDIRAQVDNENTAIIDIDGEIGWASYDGEDLTWNTPEAIKKKLREIQDLKADKIIVNINSLGGYVNDGLAIHDVLAMHPAQVETRVIGMTASAATIIAQAGNVRKMSENALYLIHRSWGFAMGNKNTMQEFVNELETIDKRMLSIYTKRSGNKEEDILSLMEESEGAGKWIDAEEAKKMGLIDESFEPMKVAASVTQAQFAKMGLPAVPKNDVQFADEPISQKAPMTIKLDDKAFFEKLDKRIDAIKSAGVISKTDEVIDNGNEEENEAPTGKSDEVAPEGISCFEAQIKVNSNYK